MDVPLHEIALEDTNVVPAVKLIAPPPLEVIAEAALIVIVVVDVIVSELEFDHAIGAEMVMVPALADPEVVATITLQVPKAVVRSVFKIVAVKPL